jgi:hypothetical protein
MLKYMLKEDFEKLQSGMTRTTMLLNQEDLTSWECGKLFIAVEIRKATDGEDIAYQSRGSR